MMPMPIPLPKFTRLTTAICATGIATGDDIDMRSTPDASRLFVDDPILRNGLQNYRFEQLLGRGGRVGGVTGRNRVEPEPVKILNSASISAGWAISDPENQVSHLTEHLRFLWEVSRGSKPLISGKTSQFARFTWFKLWEASGYSLPIPVACTGPDGKLMYTWDKGPHHLEVEFSPDSPVEFFYRNRQTGELWGEDGNETLEFPESLIDKLKLFS